MIPNLPRELTIQQFNLSSKNPDSNSENKKPNKDLENKEPNKESGTETTR